MFPKVYATLTKLHAKGAHVLCQNACIFSHSRECTGERIVIVTNESIERFKSQDAVSKAISKKIGRLTGFCTQANVPCLVWLGLCFVSLVLFRKSEFEFEFEFD